MVSRHYSSSIIIPGLYNQLPHREKKPNSINLIHNWLTHGELDRWEKLQSYQEILPFWLIDETGYFQNPIWNANFGFTYYTVW